MQSVDKSADMTNAVSSLAQVDSTRLGLLAGYVGHVKLYRFEPLLYSRLLGIGPIPVGAYVATACQQLVMICLLSLWRKTGCNGRHQHRGALQKHNAEALTVVSRHDWRSATCRATHSWCAACMQSLWQSSAVSGYHTPSCQQCQQCFS